jgi:hypothetical protein
MTATDPANLAAIKSMAQQAADIALAEITPILSRVDRALLLQENKVETSVPALMKWAGGILTAILTAGIIALFFWLVSSVSEMQQTLVRIDERQKAQVDGLDTRFSDYDRRIRRLETLHQLDGGEKP